MQRPPVSRPKGSPSRRLARWLPVAVLLSGAGLLAVAASQLWRAAGSAQAQAELAARDQAAATAVAVRSALERPEFLEAVRDLCVFRISRGKLVFPEALGGWVEQAPGWAAGAGKVLDPVVRDRLMRVDRMEFGGSATDRQGSGEGFRAAARVIQETLEREDLTPGDRQAVRQRFRWLRLRHPEIEAALPEPSTPRAKSGPRGLSDLLLQGLEGQRLPRDAEVRLLRCPLPRALAALDRLGSAFGRDTAGRATSDGPTTMSGSGQHTAALAALTATLRAAEAQREELRRVLAWQRSGALPSRRVVLPLEERVILWFPDEGDSAEKGAGRGAIVTPGALLTRLHSGGQAGSQAGTALLPRLKGELVLSGEEGAAPPPPGTQVVVPGLLEVRPEMQIAPGFWSSPWAMPTLGVGLAVVFGAGLFLTLRTLRREADANAARAEFLTAVTHELRTPMASIRLVAEMLADGTVQGEPDRQEYLGMLGRESQRLTLLLENVLDLRRLERGERVQDVQRYELRELVEEVLDVFRPVADREGVTVTWQPAGGALPVDVDRTAVQQALLNLLDNARKYGGRDGQPAAVTVTLGEGGGGTPELRIADGGHGVPVSERAQIFERFARGEEHSESAVPGVGLGLHLARALARIHGGDLVYVEQAMGACFALRIPRAKENSDA